MKNLVLILFFIVPLGFIMNCTKEQIEPESGCSGIVTPHLVISNKETYAIKFDVTNTGDKEIEYVGFSFTVYLSNGTSDQRKASYPIVNVIPGETKKDIYAVIVPGDVDPSNPKWIRFEGDIIKVEFSTPEIRCAQF